MTPALSLYLDLIRFLAALAVFLTHASSPLFGGTGAGLFEKHGHEAVMVFFVLSGFVISFVTQTKENHIQSYILNRLARLYSVSFPALFLVLVLDYTGALMAPSLYLNGLSQDSYPVLRILINALFLNEIWFESIRPFTNAPYWSLGYEFWYYILFACFTFFSGRQRWLWLGIVVAIAGVKIILLLPVWLIGVWLYRYLSTHTIPEVYGWLMCLLSLVGFGLYHALDLHAWGLAFTSSLFGEKGAHALSWSNAFLSDWLLGLLVGLHFISIAGIQNRLSGWFSHLYSGPFIKRGIVHFAGMTFSLYLFHFPLLVFFSAATFQLDSAWRHLLIVFVTFFCVWVLAFLTERKKFWLKTKMTRLWSVMSGKVKTYDC